MEKENIELRKEIIELKVHQFYLFDDKKLKELIGTVECLKKKYKMSQEQLQDLIVENDFLRKNNCKLKN